MFHFSEMPEGRIVPWSRLQPGMIFLSGLTVNNMIPKELADYPVLDRLLIDTLRNRYRLNRDRNVKVLVTGSEGLSPMECADIVNEAHRKVISLNSFRRQVWQQRQKFQLSGRDIMSSDLVHNDSLILPYNQRRIRPSLLNRLDFSLDVADLFFEDFRRSWNLPSDRILNVHLAVDFSYSMEASGRDVYVQSAVNVFFKGLSRILENTRFRIYGFSDQCRILEYPVTGTDMPRKETYYTSFLDKVLWDAEETEPTLVIVFTDGLPTDRDRTLNRLAMLKARGLDYLQIIFNIEGDKREYVRSDGHDSLDGYLTESTVDIDRFSEEEYRSLIRKLKSDFTEMTEVSGGSQAILNIDEALALVSVEGFDRWLGNTEETK